MSKYGSADRAFGRGIRSFALAAAVAGVAGLSGFAIVPAAVAQQDDSKKAFDKEVKRIASERAARVRDLLTVIALAAQRTHAISFGRIEASADGETVRIHNLVYVEKEQPVVQIVRLLEVTDFDRNHFLPRHIRIRGDGDFLLETIPPQFKAVVDQLNLPHVKTFSDIELKLDEKTGVMEVRRLLIEWQGQGRIVLSMRLENFPPLNELIHMSQAGDDVAVRMGQVRFSSFRLRLASRTLHDVGAGVLSMMHGMTKERARQEIRNQLDGQLLAAKQPVQKELIGALKTLTAGPGVADVSVTASPAISFDRLPMFASPDAIFRAAKVKVEAKNLPADQIMPGKLPAPWQNYASSDDTDPPAHQCDRLAADPLDTRRKGNGVPRARMNAIFAMVACTRATLEYPKAVRFQYQLGRAMLFSGNRPAARIWLKRAADGGYNPAKALLPK